jgi:hypothetical protein
MKTNNFVQNIIAKYKSQFVPVRDTKLGIYIPTGAIAKAVKCDGSYGNPEEYRVFIDGELTTVPAALVTTSIPVYRIHKPIDQLKVGDIVRTGDEKKFTYRLVTKIEDGKVYSNTYGGKEDTKITAIKDLFVDTKTVSTVVNLMQGFNFGGQGGVLQNPMLLALLNDEDGDTGLDTMIMLNMFGQQSGLTNNNLLPFLLMKDGDFDTKTLMLMQMMQGQGTQTNNLLPLLLMSEGGRGDKDMFLMMAMMGGNSPFSQLFSTTAAPTTNAPVAAPAPTAVVTDEPADDTSVAIEEFVNGTSAAETTEA